MRSRFVRCPPLPLWLVIGALALGVSGALTEIWPQLGTAVAAASPASQQRWFDSFPSASEPLTAPGGDARFAPVSPPGTAATVIAAPDGGTTPQVCRLDAQGRPATAFFAFDQGFRGGVRVALGDVNGDRIPEVLAAPGDASLGGLVRLFVNPSVGNLAGEGHAFPNGFLGGVYVGAADVNGDGRDDIIVGAGAGGAPTVRAFSIGNTAGLLASFLALPAGFAGGVHVAAGDVNGDGLADIITGSGPGGGDVKLFGSLPDGRFTLVGGGTPFGGAFAGGVNVGAGDVNGDGRAEIIVGAGPGAGPHVRVFDIGPGGARELVSFFAYEQGFQGGVRVAAGDVNGDGFADVIVAPGPGRATQIRAFPVQGNQIGPDIYGNIAAFPGFQGGLFIAAW